MLHVRVHLGLGDWVWTLGVLVGLGTLIKKKEMSSVRRLGIRRLERRRKKNRTNVEMLTRPSKALERRKTTARER